MRMAVPLMHYPRSRWQLAVLYACMVCMHVWCVCMYGVYAYMHFKKRGWTCTSCVCVCVCVYIYIYIYTHTHIYIYIHTHIHTRIHTHTHNTHAGQVPSFFTHISRQKGGNYTHFTCSIFCVIVIKEYSDLLTDICVRSL